MTNEATPRTILTEDERRALQSAEAPIKEARVVLDKLAEIGVNVEEERRELDAQDGIRKGLLDRFSTARGTRRRRG